MPGVTKWAVVRKSAWDTLLSEAKRGATVLITYDGGSLIDLQSAIGLKSEGNVRSNCEHTARFAFGDVKYRVNQELSLVSVGAEVLAQNECGNIVMSRNKYGKGEIYFLNFPLERDLFTLAGAFNDTLYCKIYALAAKKILAKRPIVSSDPQVCITLHPLGKKEYIACAINYSNKERELNYSLNSGWSAEYISGGKTVPACSAVFLRVTEK